MVTPLKFRAWDKNSGHLYYADDTHMFEIFSTGWHLIAIDELGPRIVCGQVEGGRDDGVLMQWIGLQDMYSVDVYSSDVIGTIDGLLEVRFNTSAIGSGFDFVHPQRGVWRGQGAFQVHGNIHEHPHLLESAA